MTTPYDSSVSDADIAVVGMAGRFPGARDLAQFWQNLSRGVESVSRLTDAELAAAGVPEAIRRSPEYVPVSSRLDDVDRFDAEFFGYSPREAALLDPQARVCLELAWHALEDAGYDPLAMPDAVGVFATASLSTYLLQNLAGALDPQDFVLGLGNIPVVLGNGADFVSTRISYKLNLRGPSQTVQTACSSSLLAIHQARQSILNGECDVALAGGVSIYLPQDRGYRWQDGMILSSDGHCRAFDAAADGVLFGRGGGMVVLKSAARALEDGDRVRAVIKGSAVNNDGSRKVGFTAPSAAGQARVITEALADAGVRADTVSYVEAHGTGTVLGDPIEIAGLTEAFRKHTPRTGYCAIGTVKTNIGHLDVAAGVTAFIKTVLMLEHRQLVPSLNFQSPNPAIDFASTPFVVNAALRDWEGIAGRRRAGVSAFGIGGTNVHLIVEEGTSADEAAARASRPVHLMRVTARTDDALGALCTRIADRLDAPDAPSIDDATFTANIGRAHHAKRVVVRGASAIELSEALRSAAAGTDDPRVIRGERAAADAPPIAFLFTGLGAQAVGMGATLFREEPVFRAALERCDAVLRAYLDRPLLSVIYPASGESSPIDEATYGQPVMFAFEYAVAELWKAWGVRPAAVLGHSLGEYAGATVAGLLPVEEGLRLVATRARLADTLPPGGGMAAVFASEEQVRRAIEPDAHCVWVASINGPQSIVISGSVDGLTRVSQRLVEQQVEVRMLNVTQGFHSAMLDPILDEYEREVARTRFGRAEIPIISNVTGQRMDARDARDARYWRRHAREVVRFAEGVQTLYDLGIRHFVEIGPHTTATAMAASNIADESALFVPSLRRGRDDYDQLFETLSSLYARGVDIDWAAVHSGRPGRRAGLPLYPFARTRHWIDAPPAESRRTDAGATAYPMLGDAIRSPALDTPVYALAPDTLSRASLADHRVRGSVILPATAYIEAALEAGERAGLGSRTIIEDLEISESLELDAVSSTHAQVIVRGDAEGADVEIFAEGAPSRAAFGTAESWRRHAHARLRRAAAAPAREALALDAIRARCATSLDGADLYERFSALGFAYGPSFSGVLQVWIGADEVLAEVRAPDAIAAASEMYRAHPALLDACLQAALLLAPSGRALLPTRIDRVDIDVLSTRLFAHVVRRGASADSRAMVVDVRIANERGEIVAAVDGISMHEAGERAAWRRWLYEPVWRQAEAVSENPTTTGTRRWFVVGAGATLIDALEQRHRSGAITVRTATAAEFLHDPRVMLERAVAGGSLDAVIVSAPEGEAQPPGRQDGTRLLLAAAQALAGSEGKAAPRLWVLTAGSRAVRAGDAVDAPFDASMWGLANVISLEQPELRCSCIDLDSSDRVTSLAAACREIDASGTETRVAIRRDTRFVERLERVVAERDGVPVPRALVASSPGELSGLRYADVAERAPRAGEIQIAVRAAGLNFKDVLTAVGRFPAPGSGFGHECAGDVIAVGTDVTEFTVGDSVIAFAAGSLSTRVNVDARLAAKKPAALSYEQAATIAGGFVTADYALRELAHVGSEDRVLIHAASGGVGLAAVQLAQRAGATVFATAGSDAKRELLRSLGVSHVYDSRSTAFAAGIDADTSHRGVTVVLNSLAGAGFEASVRALAPGGRFVDLAMGSVPSPGARARFASDLSYFNPNVAVEAAADPARVGRMLRQVVARVAAGELSPLPFQTFDSDDVSGAFRLMARAGHVGKIVVRTNARDRSSVGIASDGAYLIVGGLGGLGMLVAERLVRRGARDVAILARRAPSEAETQRLEQLRAAGARITLLRGDVSSRADVDASLATLRAELPRLRGVVQAAGVLDDGVLVQQTWPRFERVMAPKVDGSWHLHDALVDADLDFFVLFSSVASLLGSAGQGNHAAANAFLDSLAHRRRARGLAAVSVNWGAWAEAGAAADGEVAARIAARGLGQITPEQGLAAFDALIDWPRAQVGVAPVDWTTYVRQFPDGVPPVLSDVVRAAALHDATRVTASTTAPSAERATLAQRAAAVSDAERRTLVDGFVRDHVGRVLGLAASRQLDRDTPLVAMGLDSLLAVELRNALNRGAGLERRLPATLLFDYPTLRTLSDHLSDLLAAAAPASTVTHTAPEPTTPSHGALDERQIAELSDAEAEALLLEEMR